MAYKLPAWLWLLLWWFTQHYFSTISVLIGLSRKIAHIIYSLRQVVKIKCNKTLQLNHRIQVTEGTFACHFYTLFSQESWIMSCELSFRNTWIATSDSSTQNLTLFRRHNYQRKQVRFEYRRAQYFLTNYSIHCYSSWIVRK